MANDVVTLTYGGLPLRVLQLFGEPWFVLRDVEVLIGSFSLVARAPLLGPDDRAGTLRRRVGMPAGTVIVTLAGLRKLLGWSQSTAAVDRRATYLRRWLNANLAGMLAAEVQP